MYTYICVYTCFLTSCRTFRAPAVRYSASSSVRTPSPAAKDAEDACKDSWNRLGVAACCSSTEVSALKGSSQRLSWPFNTPNSCHHETVSGWRRVSSLHTCICRLNFPLRWGGAWRECFFFVAKTSPEKRTNTTLGLHPLLCFVNIPPGYYCLLFVTVRFFFVYTVLCCSGRRNITSKKKKTLLAIRACDFFCLFVFFFKRTIAAANVSATHVTLFFSAAAAEHRYRRTVGARSGKDHVCQGDMLRKRKKKTLSRVV